MVSISSEKTAGKLWLDKNFIRFWLATVFSALGDSANFILASWFVVDVTGSEGTLGKVLLCISLPRLVFMLAGGVVADRINRKHIMIFSVLARAVVLGTFGLILWRGETAVVTVSLYAMAIIFGIVDAFFWPARDSMLPQVVAKEHLSTANSLLQTSQQLSMVVGPLLAALLLHLADYPARFFAIAIAFLLSTFLLTTLKFTLDCQADAIKSKTTVLGDLSAGVRYVLTIRPITIVMIAALFINVLVAGPINIGLPVLVKELGWDGSYFGYLEGAIGIGAIAGGLLTGLAKGFRGRYLLLSGFIAGMGCGIAAIGFIHTLSFGILALLITGMMMSMVNIPIITYIQTVSEKEMLGRVMSLLSLTSMGLAPVSFALTSFVLQQGMLSPANLMRVGGFTMALLGLSTILAKEFRQMEEYPAWKNVHTKNIHAKEESAEAF